MFHNIILHRILKADIRGLSKDTSIGDARRELTVLIPELESQMKPAPGDIGSDYYLFVTIPHYMAHEAVRRHAGAIARKRGLTYYNVIDHARRELVDAMSWKAAEAVREWSIGQASLGRSGTFWRDPENLIRE